MEPTDKIFDDTHDYFDDTGNKVHHPSALSSDAARPGIPYRRSRLSPHVHSVLLSEGLHLSSILDRGTTKSTISEVHPRLFNASTSKARLTWFGALCLAGIGMFVEAYVIITTGQIKTVWHSAMPTCFSSGQEAECPENINCCGLFLNTLDTATCEQQTNSSSHASEECNTDGTYRDDFLCNTSVTRGVSYAEFAGIMLGMITFGKVADLMGRHMAGILTAAFQVIGVAMMTFYKSPSYNTLFIVFDIFFFIFGFGVGGEYPLTAANAASHHIESIEEAELDDHARHVLRILREKERVVRRGETIAVVFAMQGVGAVTGSIFLLCLIYLGNQSRVECNNDGNNPAGQDFEALDAIWRSFYLIGMIFVVIMLVYRAFILEEGDGHKRLLARKQRRLTKLGLQSSTFKILKFYAPRLIGTGGSWFLVDIAFYGLKLFSGPIFSQINPNGDLVTLNGYLLVNNLCGLAGYYCAARVIDVPSVGRKKLQTISFLVCASIFLLTGAIFDKTSPQVLMFLYFFSSFVVNFGPNVTSYVMAAETYPTELRGTCHGISAFWGKAGALFATITFGSLTPAQIFFLCGGTCIIGALFTLLFSVDLTHVSLAEHDAQLELFLEGRLDEYKGKLNSTKHLSWYERMTGRHGEYDPKWALKLLREVESALSETSMVEIEAMAIQSEYYDGKSASSLKPDNVKVGALAKRI